MTERAGSLEAGAAIDGLTDDLRAWSEWWGKIRRSRSEQSDDTPAECRSHMHQPGIIADHSVRRTEQIHRRTLYIGDPAIELLDYINGFSRALTGRGPGQAPSQLTRSTA